MPQTKKTGKRRKQDTSYGSDPNRPVVALGGSSGADEQTESSKRRKTQAPTVQEIVEDSLTSLSLQNWAPLGPDEKAQEAKRKFKAKIIEDIYRDYMQKYDLKRIMLLEVSHYLENYLWKYFDPKKSTFAHVMSILITVNEKFRENVSAWDCFHQREEVFPLFFERVLNLRTEKALSDLENTFYVVFLINCYQSLEDAMVSGECVKLVSLQMWHSLNPLRLEKELKSLPKFQKRWKQMQEKPSKSSHEKSFIFEMIQEFFRTLNGIQDATNTQQIRYCERFVEFLIDLVCQIPTRKFFHAVLQDCHLIVKTRMSKLYNLPEGKLFNQLVEMLRFFEGFDINDYTGEPLSEEDASAKHATKIQNLQRVAYSHFQPDLKNLALSNIGAIDNREGLLQHLKPLSDAQLRQLAVKLALLPPTQEGQKIESRDFILEITIMAHERRMSQIEAVNSMPIYPNDQLLWDKDIIPSDEYSGEHPLALPKLNLQFLSFYDYLLRNYDLFRLESSYEIRSNLEDAIRRVQPRKSLDSKKTMEFQGWSRMALPIQEIGISRVGPSKLGEIKPSEVIADVRVSLHQFKGHIRQEWDSIKLHDVLFLVTLRPTVYPGDKINPDLPFPEQYGVTYVRGCEVKEVYDEEGTLMKDWELEKTKRVGNNRTFKVWLDTSQYQTDLEQNEEDVYGTFNLLIRRKPKENNFKAVLETIRELMNVKTAVPSWLHDIFLGYGDPASVINISQIPTVDYVDTFLNLEHLIHSFPDQKLKFVGRDGKAVSKPTNDTMKPPFRLTFPSSKDQKHNEITVQSYRPAHRGPYPQDKPKENQVPFTPVQVNVIKQAMNEGLTLVVGPPGTGKTDTAVQIISNWYHNFPEDRILLVTHSNQALNQLFEKIMALDIDERHLLRLGHGEEFLETIKDFSKYGRVNYMLERRLIQLAEVDRLARSLGVREDVGYTCETSEHFYTYHVITRWDGFLSKCKKHKESGAHSKDFVADNFPFSKYFLTAPQPVFTRESFDEDYFIAQGCYRHINKIFSELKDCRGFELLISPSERANYLVTKQARIVAMTCTHAALKRAELVKLGFKYDNILMEEAAQILDIETLIPMALQEPDAREKDRLKRIVLIGDHNQLPPVIKNIAFQKYSHFDQSLFTRFVRLGVPTITLDSQGRARPSLAALYNWRYKILKDLPTVEGDEFKGANPGFQLEYQAIDVGDFNDQGEISPTPFFYQNLGEAEYVVATFMYMRLLGYPANKISIITTYNGQKHLIRDVLGVRCPEGSIYGKPAKVTTVDRFQGQQNDYILLSLVRTKAVGHLRDIRRLVVAMSRARLGLYVFCRMSLFENCYELTQTFSKLRQRPSKLMIIDKETYPTQRKMKDTVTGIAVQDVFEMGNIVFNLQNIKLREIEAQQAEIRSQQVQQVSMKEDSESSSSEEETEETAENPSKESKQEEDKEQSDQKMKG